MGRFLYMAIKIFNSKFEVYEWEICENEFAEFHEHLLDVSVLLLWRKLRLTFFLLKDDVWPLFVLVAEANCEASWLNAPKKTVTAWCFYLADHWLIYVWVKVYVCVFVRALLIYSKKF